MKGLSLLLLVPLAASAAEPCNPVPYDLPSASPPGLSLSANGAWLAAAGQSRVHLFKDPLAEPVASVEGGEAVSIHGSRMAVGSGGAVRVYRNEGDEWQPVMPVLEGRTGTRFGASVAIGDQWLVVGAPEDGASRDGAAYVYSATTLMLERVLRPGDGRLNDRFGASVAVDGNTIVVGAPYADDLQVFYNFGAAYVFDARTDAPIAKLQADTTFRQGDIQFGASVAVRGNSIVVGAPGDDPSRNESAGSAHLFHRGQGGWSKKAELTHSGPSPGRQLGISVAIDEAGIAVGAIGDGSAYFFTLDGNPDGQCGCGGHFGRSVALWTRGEDREVFLGDTGGVKGCFKVQHDPEPDLTCELEALPASVVAGGTAAYKVRVTNRGTGPAEPARLEVEAPRDLSAGCTPKGCSAPISAGESRSFVVSFTLPPGCSSPPSIAPRFFVLSGTGEKEDCSPPPILVQRPKMDLVCRKSGPESVEPGGRVVYQVDVTNNGCEPFRDVDISDPAPPFLERDCGGYGSACASRIARIEPGETRNVSFAFRIPSDYPHTAIMNVASIVQAKPPEAEPGNNSCTVRTEVRCPGLPLGVQATVEGEKSEVVEGRTFTFHLRLANGGPGVLEDGPRSELIQTTGFNFLSWEIVAGGGQLYYGGASGFPMQDLHWNGTIPRCGNVDILVTATADHAGEYCLDATFVDLDGRLRPATPYCFRVVPDISLPSGGR